MMLTLGNFIQGLGYSSNTGAQLWSKNQLGGKLHLSQAFIRVSSLLARSAKSGRCYCLAVQCLGGFTA